MALKRVWTTRPIEGVPAQHRSTFIVGDIVGLGAQNSLKVKITHSCHPEYQVGKKYLLCGKRLNAALMDGDRVLDERTLDEITPEPVPSGGGKA